MKNDELNSLGIALSPFVVGAEGNISKRVFDGFLIKNSGKSFRDNSFAFCKMNGEPISGKPSMEASFHAFIYGNSDYKFIAHTHPTNTLKILCTSFTNCFSRKRLFPDQVVFNGAKSCVVPYATPGEELTESIRSVITDRVPNLLLLKNHGIIVCADSIQQAINMTEVCEKAAEIFIGARLLSGGNTHYLTQDNITAIQNHKDEAYRYDH